MKILMHFMQKPWETLCNTLHTVRWHRFLNEKDMHHRMSSWRQFKVSASRSRRVYTIMIYRNLIPSRAWNWNETKECMRNRSRREIVRCDWSDVAYETGSMKSTISWFISGRPLGSIDRYRVISFEKELRDKQRLQNQRKFDTSQYGFMYAKQLLHRERLDAIPVVLVRSMRLYIHVIVNFIIYKNSVLS